MIYITDKGNKDRVLRLKVTPHLYLLVFVFSGESVMTVSLLNTPRPK
jgi:hypothetical protein